MFYGMPTNVKYPFGNPETKAFDRQFLRNARHGETEVRVHQKILPLVTRILIGLDQAGIDVTGAQPVDDPLRLGFKLDVPDVELVSAMVEPAGFTYVDGVFTFTGTPEKADELSEAIGFKPDIVEPEDITEEPAEAPEGLPRISASIQFGDTGHSVVFIQHLIGIEPTGDFDELTETRLKEWQSRHWAEPDGFMNASTWKSVLPIRAGWIRPGATGHYVRVIQAAFLALGVQNTKVTGVWGTRLSHSLRLYQIAQGLHVRSRIGSPEWDELFENVATE